MVMNFRGEISNQLTLVLQQIRRRRRGKTIWPFVSLRFVDSASGGLYFLHIFPLTFTNPIVFHERVLLGPK